MCYYLSKSWHIYYYIYLNFIGYIIFQCGYNTHVPKATNSEKNILLREYYIIYRHPLYKYPKYNKVPIIRLIRNAARRAP